MNNNNTMASKIVRLEKENHVLKQTITVQNQTINRLLKRFIINDPKDHSNLR